jgi:ligand-binding sensor domain-containing protein
MSWRRQGLVAVLLCAMLDAAQAQPKPPVAPRGPRVVESFEVGENVYVRALNVEPATRTLWVGTSTGVNEVDLASGKLRNTFTRTHGLANEYVFAVGIDRQGYKWFGTNAGGTSRYRDGQWKTFFPMHGLADYWVYAFANDLQGNLWIGTWAGASRYDPRSGKLTTFVKELINEWVYGIAVDNAGRVWFGTEGGVSMFDGKTWKAWTHRDGLGAPNEAKLPASTNTGLGTRSRHDLNVQSAGMATFNPNYVFSMHAAPDGTVWAGTWGGGVSRFDGKQWQNFTVKDGLAGNLVYAIAQDARGVMWFGTENGVSRYDGKTWQNFRRQDGLLENNVYALAAAPDGSLWAGTKRGVARIATP